MRLILSLLIILFSANSWAVKRSCEENYVPPYDLQLLDDVKAWAMGGAFAINAKRAEVAFDKKAYLEEVPYMAIFNFGRATGTSCLEVDILGSYVSMVWVFDNYFIKILKSEDIPEKSFKEFYLEQAEKYGFDRYISEPVQEN